VQGIIAPVERGAVAIVIPMLADILKEQYSVTTFAKYYRLSTISECYKNERK
jgi:hypothetical protein